MMFKVKKSCSTLRPMSELHFEKIAPIYNVMNDIISLGMHRWWKKSMVSETMKLAPQNPRCLDVSTGTGDIALLMAKNASSVIGLDPSGEMIKVAKERSESISWVTAPAENMPIDDSCVDLVTCGFGVRNYDDRSKAFAQWNRVMASGAIGSILEIHPMPEDASWPMRFWWKNIMPLLGKLFFNKDAYDYLLSSSTGFVTPQGLSKELEQAGFSVIENKSQFLGGMVNRITFRKP